MFFLTLFTHVFCALIFFITKRAVGLENGSGQPSVDASNAFDNQVLASRPGLFEYSNQLGTGSLGRRYDGHGVASRI